eukprot:GHVR01081414.1.p1 GENE.GHVR01081414.1~~GHVR01081414.1.p1  ORF type:complete len:247 (+),score=22.57 GHVR01081414.1:213-953(+)
MHCVLQHSERFAGLLWDRRNTGGSGHLYRKEDLDLSEVELQADDLRELLVYLANGRAVVLIGNSSGARLSLIFAIRHPNMAAGLVLLNVTGGKVAEEMLADDYYDQYTRFIYNRNMEQLLNLPQYRECLRQRGPKLRNELKSMDKTCFIMAMKNSSAWMTGANVIGDNPVIGVGADILEQKVLCPCIVVHTMQPEDGVHTALVATCLADHLKKGKVGNGVRLVLSSNENYKKWASEILHFLADISK